MFFIFATTRDPYCMQMAALRAENQALRQESANLNRTNQSLKERCSTAISKNNFLTSKLGSLQARYDRCMQEQIRFQRGELESLTVEALRYQLEEKARAVESLKAIEQKLIQEIEGQLHWLALVLDRSAQLEQRIQACERHIKALEEGRI